ncbi:uncharacterized protein BX664DRAFT_351189 [Halteromyces radiatus]|uniref:uncharacterized protein n=1 Tax=Halteromyces radiatus TaxID=101107 RepID=UPI00221F7C84|nr:uncharacterized protein BX664DRAFT_351189 [Halteromyces radiatus]KAI8086798.1 hypothetical protein BX664DRAFT_351189 [Halteromyces radiatus]
MSAQSSESVSSAPFVNDALENHMDIEMDSITSDVMIVTSDESDNNHNIIKSLKEAIVASESTLIRVLDEYKQLLNRVADANDLVQNENLYQRIKDRLENLNEQLRSYTNKTEKPITVVIPRNLLSLQFAGDMDAIKGKNVFETIDKFVDRFEMVLHQHRLVPDDSWEACLITSLQHSTERCDWFQETLMNKQYKWNHAKHLLKMKYSGDQSQSVYLEKLYDMKPSKWENPIRFVEKFYSTFKSAGAPDSVAFGTMLLKSLAKHHGDFVKQIKSTAASDRAHDRSPIIDVTYINNIAPRMHVDYEVDDHKKHSNRNHYYQEDKEISASCHLRLD